MPDTVVESVNALAKAVSENSKLDYHEVQVQLLGIVAAHPIQQNNILTTLDTLAAIQAAFLAWLKSHASCATKQDLREMEKRILMTQAELSAALDKLTTQVGKVAKEQSDRFDALTAKIKELTDIINAGGDVTPEVTAALAATQAALDSLDAAIPDAP